MKQLFIAWVPFQRRNISMQSHYGYELKFLSFAFKSRYLRFVEYIFKAWKTLELCLHYQPQALWLQLAPTPLLYIAHLYKGLFDRQVKIIADCHNVMFRAPWIRFPGAVAFLNQCDLVLVHNDWVKNQATAIGVTPERLYVLEDPPAVLDDEIVQGQELFPHPWILYPCSFNRDEPIGNVLAAAHLIPDITLVLTGNTARAKGIHDLSDIPPNVKLAGFLPKVEFDMLLHTTDAVLGLTMLEGIQLCAANEAVGTGKPLILSETKILKDLFYKGAVYVDSDRPESIAQCCQEAISRKSELSEEVAELREERYKRWLDQASYVDAILGSSQVVNK